MMKRFTVAVLLLAWVLPLWAGGQQDDGSGAETISVNPTGYPIVNEPVTLTVFKPINPEQTRPFNEIGVVEELAAHTGVNIEWITPLHSEAQQTINLLFASNDLPDIFLSGLTLVQGYMYGLQGMIQPIDQLMAEYAPEQTAMMEAMPELRSYLTAPDGKMYMSFSLGNFHEDYPNMLYINRAWLEDLGREMPTTTQEFEELLRIFDERDMNGNGDPDDEIPLGYVFYRQNAVWAETGFFGSFGLQMDSAVHFMAVEDGRVIYEPATDGFRDTIAWLHSLYADGLIDREAYVQDRNQFKAKVSGQPPRYGAYVSFFPQNAGGSNGQFYDVVGPLEGPDGHQVAPWRPRSAMGPGAAVTTACDHPEVAVRWLDTVYDPEWNFQLCYGQDGQFTHRSADGVWSVLDPPDGQTSEQVRFLNSLHVVPYTAGVFLEREQPEYFDMKDQAKRDLYQAHTPTDRAVPFFFLTEAEQAEFDAIIPDILTYTDQKWAQWVMEGGVEEEWDEYVARLDAMGLNDALSIWQSAYEAMMD